jgi:hypothetical protein
MVQEGGLAGGAEIVGVQSGGRGEAAAADGDTGNFEEGLAADAAIVREKSAERLLCQRQKSTAEIGQQGT